MDTIFNPQDATYVSPVKVSTLEDIQQARQEALSKMLKYAQSRQPVLKQGRNAAEQAGAVNAGAVQTAQQIQHQQELDKNKQIAADALTFGLTPIKNTQAAQVGAEDIANNVAGALAWESGLGTLRFAPKALGLALGRTNFGKSLYINRALSEAEPNFNLLNAPKIQYFGPTMGKSYAARLNPNLVDMDQYGLSRMNELAQKYGFSGWREMMNGQEMTPQLKKEYREILIDLAKQFQADPANAGKTLVTSNGYFADPAVAKKYGLIFEPFWSIPSEETMVKRGVQRAAEIGHQDSPEHMLQWRKDLLKKNPEMIINDSYVSDILPNQQIANPHIINLPENYTSESIFIKPRSEKQSIINSYDEYGLDEIPIIWDPSKSDAQNYLSRHLSRLTDMGIDYTTTELVPVSSIKLPDRYYGPGKLAEQIQKGVNMAASHANNHIVVSDNPGNIRTPILSHEIDHIFNPNYENLANGNKYVRQFLDTSEVEAALSKGQRNKFVDQELLALGSQLKDYLGFTRASQYATPEQYQDAIKNYSKVVGYDNFKGWFDKVLDWEGLADFWNRNSTVLTGAGVFSILAPYLNNDDE